MLYSKKNVLIAVFTIIAIAFIVMYSSKKTENLRGFDRVSLPMITQTQLSDSELRRLKNMIIANNIRL